MKSASKTTRKPNPESWPAHPVAKCTALLLASSLMIIGIMTISDATYAESEGPLQMHDLCGNVRPRGCFEVDNHTSEFTINRDVIMSNNDNVRDITGRNITRYITEYVIFTTTLYNCSTQTDQHRMSVIGCNLDAMSDEITHVRSVHSARIGRMPKNFPEYNYVAGASMLAAAVFLVVIGVALNFDNDNAERTHLLENGK